MNLIKKYTGFLFFLFLTVLISNCSTQRNNLVNRNLHQLTTKYNILFNGNQALEKELETLKESYHDNFFEMLPVEEFKAKYEIALPGSKNQNANLERAEEKAVKAIQKHSMNIRNVEENNRIDETYLLLGKSRYYQKRFLAASDAFNYVLDNNFKSNIRPLVRLWREKSNIRMDNDATAIRNLTFLSHKKDAPQNIRSEAYAYLGQAQIKIDSFQSASENLLQAAELAKDKEKRVRYYFITAQLLEKLNRKDSAVTLLKIIEKQKFPLKYSTQAELYRYHLSLDKKEQHPEMFKALHKKLKRYEYHKLYPYINYEIGEIFHSEDSLKNAVKYYTIAARSQDKKLKEKAYEQMSKIGFYKKDYLMAGAYLDSLLQVMPKETLKYLKTNHKRRNIDDIVRLEKLIKHNDSTMQLVNADSLGRVKLIQAYIDKLKAAEEKARAEKEAKNKVDYSQVKSKYTSFYFYNQDLVNQGKAYFKKTWGDMQLTDMWRLKNTNDINEDDDQSDSNDKEVDNQDSSEEKTVPEKYQIAYYYKQIPTSPKQIDSIAGQTNYAHYQVGLIYYDKFLEYQKAEEHLLKMLKEKPKKELIAPAKYTLYKIYKNTGKPLLAQNYAQDILNDFPNTLYADLIKNPDKLSERSNKAFKEAYQKLYKYYEHQQYDSLLKASNPMLIKFHFHPELGKVELLRATAFARADGLDAYEKALKDIILKYPKTDYEAEANKRMELVNKYKKKVYTTANSNSYKLIIPYDIFSAGTDNYISCIENVILQNKSDFLKISKDPFTRHQSFIVVHNFLSNKSAEYLAELLQNTSCRPEKYFVISSENYKTLQLTKKLKAYREFISNHKTSSDKKKENKDEEREQNNDKENSDKEGK